MTRTYRSLAIAMGLAVTVSATAVALARTHGADTVAPACQGMESGRGHGPGSDDMAGIHFLFAHRDSIARTVTEIPGGVRTLTESSDSEVTAGLQEHVQAMYARMKEHRPIHARDPLFAALFRNVEKIDVRIEKTPTGLRVSETSADPEVVKLIRRHAEVVSQFLANGMPEMMKNH